MNRSSFGRRGASCSRHELGPGAMYAGLALLLALILPGSAIGQSATNKASTHQGSGAEDAAGKSWSVTVAPYLWVAGADGTLTAPIGGTVSNSQSFSQIASNLDAGFAGLIDVRYKALHVFSDNSWVKLQDSNARPGPFVTQADVTVETAFGTAAVAYALPLEWPFEVDLYLGGRWWHSTQNVTLRNAAFAVVAAGGAEQVWGDAVGGVRLLYPITDAWRVSLMGDVGGGGSDLTWMVTGTLTWMFSEHFGVSTAYRVLGVDYRRNGWVYDFKQQGFILGMMISL